MQYVVVAKDMLAPPRPRVSACVALDPEKCQGTPDFLFVLWAPYLVALSSGVPLALVTLSTGLDIQVDAYVLEVRAEASGADLVCFP